MPGFKQSDSCPFIPGRLYTRSDGPRVQFQGHVFSPYDGFHVVEFFELDARQYRSLHGNRWEELETYWLVASDLPASADWRV